MNSHMAIFGGTFDPVHIAHLRAALEAVEELDLKRVVFMPIADPPHDKQVAAPVKHRLEMLRLATREVPFFQVSDVEARLGGKSFTVGTLEKLKRENPGDKLYFLIGSDAFFHLHTWKDPLKLFGLADFVVMARPKSPKSDFTTYLKQMLDPRFRVAENGWVRLPEGGGAHWVPTTLLSISSTDIRLRASLGLSLQYLVPPQVEEYIKRMKLYHQDAG